LNKSILFFLCIISNIIISQNEKKELFVKYTHDEIIVDGILDEPDWNQAKEASNFYEHFPDHGSKSKNQAVIKVMNDDSFIYIGIKVFGSMENLKTDSFRRDFQAGNSDNITMIFDTFNDGNNAFVIGSNHIGIQRDMLLFNGGNGMGDWDMTWDVKWLSESKVYNDYYITEWKIPLSAFKYREGETKWGVNSYMRNTDNNSWNSWNKVPENLMFFNLAFTGTMYFEKPLGKSKPKKSIIPYINSIAYNDYQNLEKGSDFDFGGDAKFIIDNSITLDLTVNPDFSQVEVDQQVTNLTRFEITLPEKRQFFIENSDLFSGFGNGREARPFFSRRIGIAKDKNGNNIENKIIAGFRLSGKINNNLRIGLLNMQTSDDVENEISAYNNSIITLQQKVFGRSNINLLLINREATGEHDYINENDVYNRILGFDYNLRSKNSKWDGKYYFHKSFSPDNDENSTSYGLSTSYESRNFGFRAAGLYIGDDFRSDLGYIRRNNIIKLYPEISYTIWPEKSKFLNHRFEFTPVFILKPELNNKISDYYIISKLNTYALNSERIDLMMWNNYTYLFEDFDPTGTNTGNPLPANSEYYYTSFDISFNSDYSKDFTYKINPSYGKFYNGTKTSLDIRLSHRIRPKFTSSLEIKYDKVKLPEPFSSANILLIAPRFEVTFSKNVYWATLMQFSNQSENLSLNTRLQWRFAPLSDLFLVYNDNYYTENRYNSIFIPRVKSRSINLKLTYWLDI
tara:strand:- start:13614 stop:15830 length:2217 start_codon:yes stop_codon:yes gene_type:complete